MNNSRGLFSVLASLVLLTSQTAGADTLMIISSSGGMFGDKTANSAMEHFGAAVATEALKGNYRRVVTWYSRDNVEIESWAREVVASQQPGEPIDVFALEHGAGSFLPGLSPETVELIFPKGMVRRHFSSGCSNWGRFTADADGGSIKVDRWGYTSHMSRLGVQEYVIHANDNSTGPLSYPLLAAEFRKGGSWLEGGKRAFENEDNLTARAAPAFSQLSEPLKKFARFISLPLGMNAAKETMVEFFHSRPVFGGTRYSEKASIFENRNMLQGEDAKTEAMLAPTPELAKVLKADLPNVFTGEREAEPAPTGAETLKQTFQALDQGVLGSLELAARVIDIYAGNKDGCVDPKVIQPLLDAFLKTSKGKTPTLRSFCLKKNTDTEYVLKWSLGPTGKLHFPGMDVWDIALPAGLDTSASAIKIRNLFLRRHGSLTIYVKKERTGFKLSGLGIKAEGPALTRKLKVPNGVMHFSLRGGWINDQGHFIAKIGTWIFGARVGVEGDLNEDGAHIADLNIAGIKIKIHL